MGENEEYSILVIGFGNVEVDLLSINKQGAHLQDGGYAPGVHRRRRGRAGGLGTHEEVAESITINIDGNTPAECLAVLADIAYILDQADAWRWPRATKITAPFLKCRPVGSNEADPLIGYLIGSGDKTLLELPVTFNDELHIYEITGVELHITRMPWLKAVEETDATPLLPMPAINIATFPTSQNTPSPLQVTISSNLSLDTPGARVPSSFLFVTNTPARLAVVEAEAAQLPTLAPYSIVNESANIASNNNVMAFTPNGNKVDFQLTKPIYISEQFQEFVNQRVACYAMLQVTGDDEGAASIMWRGGSSVYEFTAANSVEVNRIDNEVPTMVYLGTVFVSDGVAYAQLAIKDHSGTTSIVIDYLVFISLDDVTSRVIALDGRAREGLVWTLATDIQTSEWWRTQRAQVNAHNERVALPNVDVPLGHLGRADLVSTGTTVCALWCATGNEDTEYFRATRDGVPLQVNMRARRAPLSIVPQ